MVVHANFQNLAAPAFRSLSSFAVLAARSLLYFAHHLKTRFSGSSLRRSSQTSAGLANEVGQFAEIGRDELKAQVVEIDMDNPAGTHRNSPKRRVGREYSVFRQDMAP
jgi:hypothetical protein